MSVSPRARRPEPLRTVAPLIVTALLAVSLCCAPAASARSVPRGFFGVMADGALFEEVGHRTQVAEQAQMVRAGVESERLLLNWAGAQPYATFARVPRRLRSKFHNLGGVPTDLGSIDRKIGAAAAAGMRVLPVVVFSPRWAASNRYVVGAEPTHPSDYARFLRVLVQRYGPRGVFWRSHPAPFSARVRQWQIWNEEDLQYFWTDSKNFARGYVELLRSARSAIKSVDPGGKIVLGGLTSSLSWPQVWDAFDALYKAGGRGLFDIAAVHPYTRDPEGVIKIIERVRAVMRAHGDGSRALAVTEMGWASSRGKTRNHLSWEVTPSQQARNVARVYALMAANRRRLHITAAYWFTWLSNDRIRYWSYWSGLRKAVRGRAVAKPAFGAYLRAARHFEGCRKTTLATRCG